MVAEMDIDSTTTSSISSALISNNDPSPDTPKPPPKNGPANPTPPSTLNPSPSPPAVRSTYGTPSSTPTSKRGKKVEGPVNVMEGRKGMGCWLWQMFLEKLTRDSWVYTANADRKTIAYRDVANAVQHRHELEFLEDVIPVTVTLRRALEEKARLAVESET
ncbi:hypothetical protein BC829DRAFT_399659 [Chytridium lagenaria]|nr:hypothetical protein BC829DRAFT_399659 [Chytridium lagenaria]